MSSTVKIIRKPAEIVFYDHENDDLFIDPDMTFIDFGSEEF